MSIARFRVRRCIIYNFKYITSVIYLKSSIILVGSSGLEPPTSRLSGARSNQLSYEPIFDRALLGGDDGIRTRDPLLAGQVLSQLSYTPIFVSLSLYLPISVKLIQN